jgi:hypothetical protein
MSNPSKHDEFKRTSADATQPDATPEEAIKAEAAPTGPVKVRCVFAY